MASSSCAVLTKPGNMEVIYLRTGMDNFTVAITIFTDIRCSNCALEAARPPRFIAVTVIRESLVSFESYAVNQVHLAV